MTCLQKLLLSRICLVPKLSLKQLFPFPMVNYTIMDGHHDNEHVNTISTLMASLNHHVTNKDTLKSIKSYDQLCESYTNRNENVTEMEKKEKLHLPTNITLSLFHQV